MSDSNGRVQTAIDKRDFDQNRSLLQDNDNENGNEAVVETRSSAENERRDSSDGLLNDVVEEIVERDRRRIAREVVRVGSFIWGVISW